MNVKKYSMKKWKRFTTKSQITSTEREKLFPHFMLILI